MRTVAPVLYVDRPLDSNLNDACVVTVGTSKIPLGTHYVRLALDIAISRIATADLDNAVKKLARWHQFLSGINQVPLVMLPG